MRPGSDPQANPHVYGAPVVRSVVASTRARWPHARRSSRTRGLDLGAVAVALTGAYAVAAYVTAQGVEVSPAHGYVGVDDRFTTVKVNCLPYHPSTCLRLRSTHALGVVLRPGHGPVPSSSPQDHQSLGSRRLGVWSCGDATSNAQVIEPIWPGVEIGLGLPTIASVTKCNNKIVDFVCFHRQDRWSPPRV